MSTPKLRKRGRPKFVPNWDQVQRLCHIHCSIEEIAWFSGASLLTMNTHCMKDHQMTMQEFWNKHSAGGKMSIRRKQYTVATEGKGSVAMLKWLGMNWLHQANRVSIQDAGLEQPDQGEKYTAPEMLGNAFARIGAKAERNPDEEAQEIEASKEAKA